MTCASSIPVLAQGAGSAGSAHTTTTPTTHGGIAAANTSGLVWTYASGTEGWTGRVVSIGQQGNQVFTDIDGWGGAPRLFSSNDANPPTPLWQGSGPYMSTGSQVDSAEDVAVHVEMHYAQSSSGAPKQPVLCKYSGASSTPQWSYNFPLTVTNAANGACISRDGRTIVGWVFDWSTLRTRVAVFDGASATPLSYTAFETSGEPRFAELSADGSTLLIVAQTRTIVVDVHTAQPLLASVNWEGIGPGHAICGDGSLFAKSLGERKVQVWKRSGNSYSLMFTHEGEALSQCGRMALSDDGTTLALGFSYMDHFLKVRIQALDLSSAQHPVMLDDTIQGAGQFQNVVSDVAISKNGKRFAVGLTGDQAGQAPEVLAYGADAQTGVWSRVLAYDMPGSVNDIDISGDGRHVAVASKAVHSNVAGGGGRIDLFDLEGPAAPQADLVLDGVAHVGGSVSVHQYLNAGTPALLLRAPASAANPQVFAGMGTLYLQRATLETVASGVAGPSGVLTSQVAIPTSANLIGTTWYFQGLATSPRKLSVDWVQMTINP